jgi:hypothetical protein
LKPPTKRHAVDKLSETQWQLLKCLAKIPEEYSRLEFWEEFYRVHPFSEAFSETRAFTLRPDPSKTPTMETDKLKFYAAYHEVDELYNVSNTIFSWRRGFFREIVGKTVYTRLTVFELRWGLNVWLDMKIFE